VPSPSVIILIWILGGILSFFGALAYAELGAAFPATGGQYVFLREAFGPTAAFLFGWTTFVIVMPAQIGSLAVGFAVYAGHFWSLSPLMAQCVAVSLILGLGAANYIGIRSGARIQNICTVMKLAGLGIIILSAFLWRGEAAWVTAQAAPKIWGGLALALVPCLLSYDGWNTVSFVAGEVRDPQRTFPRALAIGIGLVSLTYVLFNVAALRVMPIAVLSSTTRVGAELAEQTLGWVGADLVTFTILFSVAGSLNAALMTPARLYFAQARDGLLFRALGNVHPRYRTPATAILFQAALGAVAALVGTFQTLITYAIFSGWLFYVMTIIGLIVLRVRRPDLPRPFRMWGYPVTAILFLLAATGFLASTLWTRPGNALGALALVCAGWPVYLVWSRVVQKRAPEGSKARRCSE
jgi:APA family basic amino acid/polyamine antiporter